MCLIAFAIGVSARWPLVIAANRDEFFDRPTLPLSRWQTASHHIVFSGQDLRAGGTWLGATPSGRVAMLTNVRELHMAAAEHSRGELVVRWLESEQNADRFMAGLDPADYGGFNIVLGDVSGNQWTWLSNRSFGLDSTGAASGRAETDGWRRQALLPGIYGLSNAALDTGWPKTNALKLAMETAIQAPSEEELSRTLWQALQSDRRYTGTALPDTGLPVALEEALSSALVGDGRRGYGTRCSTLLVAKASGAEDVSGWDVTMDEITHPAAGVFGKAPDALSSLQFEWPRDGNHSSAAPPALPQRRAR
jgi:uncharacterized protein with NRDE domain